MARYPFDGEHQAGILTPRQRQATMISLDSIAQTPTELLSDCSNCPCADAS